MSLRFDESHPLRKLAFSTYHIDINTFATPPGNIEELTEAKINTWITSRVDIWYRLSYGDEDLWHAFREDFAEWTADAFKKAHKDINMLLRDHLRAWGIFIVRDGSPIASNLAQLVQDEAMVPWPEDEVAYQLSKRATFSRKLRVLSGQEEPIRLPLRRTIQEEVPEGDGNINNRARSQEPPPIRQPQFERRTRFETPSPPRTATLEFTPRPNRSRQIEHQLGRTDAGYDPVPSDQDASRALMDIAKLYTKSEDKFAGKQYQFIYQMLDEFELKLAIARVPRNDYLLALSVLLEGSARDFYYQHILKNNDPATGRRYTFDDAVAAIDDHFLDNERRTLYELKWNAIDYAQIMKDNPGKGKLECLEIMFDEMRRIQPGIVSSASIDEQMRTKAKTAVMGVPECNFALLNNPPTWSKMQTELRTSVAIAERSGKSVDQFVGEVEKMNDEYDQHFVDRTYQGGGRNGGRRDNRNRSFTPGADRSSSQSSSGSWQPRSGGSSY